MLFSTNIFVYLFLPAVISVYFLMTALWKDKVNTGNVVLLVFSLLFYLWGSGSYILVLLSSVMLNYFFGLALERFGKKRIILIAALVANIGALVYFKYYNFFAENISFLLGIKVPKLINIFLPVGISFYTFQALSYVIDVYNGKVKAQRSLVRMMLFVSFFPQLIAGPIVRYGDIEKELGARKIHFDDIYLGCCRFCMGLAKKVMLADTFGPVVDKIFLLETGKLTVPLAWAGLVLYTLQIYCDFSAYSDMAIGMARIFGFHFNENFLLPYTSKNITEFWRRWHVSLSSFFRDYVYIPLGGNRKGSFRTYVNLSIVFLLCGLWHGANWTFLLWGGYYGVLLVIERILLNKYNLRMKGLKGQLISLLLIMYGWLIFRSPDINTVAVYTRALVGANPLDSFQYHTFSYYVHAQIIAVAIFGIIISVFPFDSIRKKYSGGIVHGVTALILLLLAMIFMSDSSFTPFIYFQF